MTKEEQIQINHQKLTSAIFHLEAAYHQVGHTFNTTMVYNAIESVLKLTKGRLSVNETQT